MPCRMIAAVLLGVLPQLSCQQEPVPQELAQQAPTVRAGHVYRVATPGNHPGTTLAVLKIQAVPLLGQVAFVRMECGGSDGGRPQHPFPLSLLARSVGEPIAVLPPALFLGHELHLQVQRLQAGTESLATVSPGRAMANWRRQQAELVAYLPNEPVNREPPSRPPLVLTILVEEPGASDRGSQPATERKVIYQLAGEELVGMGQLATALRLQWEAASRDPALAQPLEIRPGASALYGDVAKVTNAARHAGFEDIRYGGGGYGGQRPSEPEASKGNPTVPRLPQMQPGTAWLCPPIDGALFAVPMRPLVPPDMEPVRIEILAEADIQGLGPVVVGWRDGASHPELYLKRVLRHRVGESAGEATRKLESELLRTLLERQARGEIGVLTCSPVAVQVLDNK